MSLLKNYFLTGLLLTSLNSIGQSNIPSYVPAGGLVGWWPFTGNAVDSSGNANNGTVSNANLTTDRFGNLASAYAFNGTNSRIDVADAASLRIRNMTLSAWIQTNILESKEIIYKGSLNAGSEALSFRSASAAIKQNSNCLPGVGWKVTSYTAALPIAVWTHLTATYDGLSIKLYKNGFFDTSYSTSGLIDSCIGGGLRFGFNHTVSSPSILGDPFNGTIDDIGIWNRALTLKEIQDLYNASLTVSGNVGINNLSPQRNLHVNDVLRLEPRNFAPFNPSKGDIYFDGTLNKLRVYDGTTWQNCW